MMDFIDETEKFMDEVQCEWFQDSILTKIQWACDILEEIPISPQAKAVGNNFLKQLDSLCQQLRALRIENIDFLLRRRIKK